MKRGEEEGNEGRVCGDGDEEAQEEGREEGRDGRRRVNNGMLGSGMEWKREGSERGALGLKER